MSEDSIAVSYAKVAFKVSSVVGVSAVKMRYNKGPRTLPCGTPACTGSVCFYFLSQIAQFDATLTP